MCFACKELSKTQNKDYILHPDKGELKGHFIPQDSLEPPVRIDISHVKGIKSRSPDTILAKQSTKPLSNIKESEIFIHNLHENRLEKPSKVKLKSYSISAQKPEIYKAGTADKRTIDEFMFYYYNDKNGLKNKEPIQEILFDSKGNLWAINIYTSLMKFDGQSFSYWTEEQGLKETAFRSFYIDENDEIWIVGIKGLTHFDGHNFQYFMPEDAEFESFQLIEVDQAGKFWLSGNTGLYRFDPRTKKCVKYGKEQGVDSQTITYLFCDSKNHLWLATKDQGIKIMNIQAEPGDPSYFIKQITNGSLFPCNQVTVINEDSQGNILMGSTEGITLLKKVQSSNYTSAILVNIFSSNGLPELKDNRSVILIKEKEPGRYYTIFNGIGLIIINYNHQSNYIAYSRDANIDPFYNNISFDTYGNVWLANYKAGIIKMQMNPFKSTEFFQFGEDGNINLANMTNRFCEDKWGRLWMGTFGYGIFRYIPSADGYTGQLLNYTTKQGMSSNYIDDFQLDTLGNIWIGTRNNGLIKMELDSISDIVHFYNYTEKEGFPVSLVPQLIMDNTGDIWGTLYEFDPDKTSGIFRIHGNEVLFYTEAQGLLAKNTWDMDQDTDLNFWVSSIGKGLNHIKIKGIYNAPEVTHFETESGLPGRLIRAITPDQYGGMWVGAESGNKLMKIDYDIADETYYYTSYGSQQGLINNNIQALLQDKNGNLWIGNEKGLSMKPIHGITGDEAFTNYLPEDGLPEGGIANNSIFQFKNSDIWISGGEGIVRFNHDDIKIKVGSPELKITNLYIYNESLNWVSDSTYELPNGIVIKNYDFDSLTAWNNLPINLSLSHNNNFISFDFVGVNLKAPHLIKYSYYLENWSSGWSAPSGSTNAVFGKLSPGKYNFKVKAKIENGDWSEIDQYSFTIRPPFWNTLFAYFIYLILIVLAIYFYIRFRIKSELAKVRSLENIRSKISADLHDDVGSVLTGIAMQTEYLATEKTEDIHAEMIEIGGMSRNAMERMRDIVWAIDAKKDRYENLVDRMRYFASNIFENSDFNYSFELTNISMIEAINPEVRQNIYLIFKEAITNVSKHSNGNDVKIKFFRLDNQLHLTVIDNGNNANIKNCKTEGLGLDNMNMRAKSIDAKLSISYEQGFKVHLII
ncbi:sensor histidine kinase [Portibacter lacus]|uniref:histidine kinase n=1 Tax=Portibacter lacus TaxID=1099794 RepID=A0AA37STV8_9BACT|nr:sensor histidine kinase [Portibacter lacus]GLR19564.1 hypothetical protein GCM10007940_41800 [Portibacter lacus]